MTKKIKSSTLFFFTLPQLALAAVVLPLFVHLPPFYASHIGISLTAVGLIFMFARFWDVFTDPIFGLLADKWRPKFGVRRAWMLVALPILMISVLGLFFPPSFADEAYLSGFLVIVFVGWTIGSITHYSWGAELTYNYDERVKVEGAAQFVVMLGTMIVLIFPAIIEAIPGTTVAQQISAMGIYILLVAPLTFWLALRYVPDRSKAKTEFQIKGAGSAIFKNRALRRLLIADFAGGFGQGSVSGLFIFFTIDVLKLNESANIVLLSFFATGLLCAPLWIHIAQRFQKHTALCVSAIYNILMLLLIFFIPEGRLDWAIFIFVLQGVNFASGPFLLRSCMSDVADADAIQNGAHRNSLFFSLLTLAGKSGFAVTIGLNYFLLDMIGFVHLGENNPEVLFSVRTLFIMVPVITSVVILMTMARFPIGRREQQETQRILEARQG